MPDTLSAIVSKPRAPRARATLFVGLCADAPHRGPARFGLEDVDTITLGRGGARAAERRASTLAIALDDARLSTQHARMTRLGARWVLEDLGSKNGTWIGGDAVQQHTLDDGDVIEVGHTMLVFRDHGGEAGDLDGAPDADAPGLATLSPALAQQFASVARGARSSVPVMIGGETGTGKELIARAVHALSGRTGPFVAVNCGAVPATLVEAELFGHRKGAFTGAGDERTGLIRSAHGGTLFLDEIGELPGQAQAALLRVLQEGEVTPVGADRAISVDVRLVTATLRDLDEEVAHGRFRGDLLGRLLGLAVRLPPLRERREDLGMLVAQLLDRASPSARIRMTPDVVRTLYAHAWPRNIRELERTLAAACALARDVIDLEHLPESVRASIPSPRVLTSPGALTDDERRLRDQLAAALAEHAGNVAAVARALGKDRTQIRRWMRRFHLLRPDDS
ncbi:MAG: sigma 54-interacting transcriptional regulator [Deltaproteobacteria bacterium]|nr:sigma 54-interacting transcriptional regulator [Deltaproteobacteria bacterium]